MSAITPTWLCDLGDHDRCNGYACECCACGHLELRTSGAVIRAGTAPDPGEQLALNGIPTCPTCGSPVSDVAVTIRGGIRDGELLAPRVDPVLTLRPCGHHALNDGPSERWIIVPSASDTPSDEDPTTR